MEIITWGGIGLLFFTAVALILTKPKMAMSSWLLGALFTASTLAAALIPIWMNWVVDETAVISKKVWIPDNGREIEVLDKDLYLPSGSNVYLEPEEISLKEFQDRGYQEIRYGYWSGAVFYWAPDPSYPSGVEAYIDIDPGFGQDTGWLVGTDYQDTAAEDSPSWPWAVFEGETITVVVEKNWDYGRTFIPDVPPVSAFFLLLTLAVFSGVGLLWSLPSSRPYQLVPTKP